MTEKTETFIPAQQVLIAFRLFLCFRPSENPEDEGVPLQ